MANKGGQIGNNNATKSKPWAEALLRALKQYSTERVKQGEALRAIADKVVEAALNGDKDAIKEIGDRMDGKPRQQTEISGVDGGPVETVTRVERVIIEK